eukprot:COSAG04_NODE_26622_length_292_cov_1.352332_1_plen_76_part_10
MPRLSRARRQPEPEPEPEPELSRADASPSGALQLPAGWTTAVSRSSGDTYYVHVATGESTYDFPAEPEPEPEPEPR